jgi:hypothetical protein
MSVFDQARVIIYRINKKGLEIFLELDESEKTPKYKVPQTLLKYPSSKDFQDKMIELDPIKNIDGSMEQVCAVEADWHEIPSVKAIIKQDLRIVKSAVKNTIPNIDKCVYVEIKDIFKKALPHEYAALKELKDVLLEKNQSKYI